MNKYFTKLIFLFLLFSGCEKSEIIELKGTIKGEIISISELGYKSYFQGDVLIKLDGSDPLISAVTDAEGKFEIRDIPQGTYNLIASREGYGEYQGQGLQIVGGKEPLYFYMMLREKSKTTVENVSLEVINGNQIHLKGIVNHNFVTDPYSYNLPAIMYFIHTSDTPSDTNYLQSDVFYFEGISGSELDLQMYINSTLFPSGSKIYVIAYGYSPYESGYYDILSNQYIYTCLGTGSNIASITIP